MANNTTDLGQSKYDFRYLTFPEDLGMSYQGHYMVININVPTGVGQGSAFGSQFNFVTGGNSRSRVDNLRFGNAVPGAQNSTAVALRRGTTRIAESIALYMPNGLTFSDSMVFQDIDMSSLAGQAAGAVVTGLASAALGKVGALAAGIVTSAAGAVVNTLAPVMGHPINPGVEVIFTTKALRGFTFDFLFAPRNERESESLKSIIRTLRFHSAPELNAGTGGVTWIPPADFDITFFKHGEENTNITRINTCVLRNVDVDYAPSGIYATFQNGHPVQVRMTLTFGETEVIHRARVLQGF